MNQPVMPPPPPAPGATARPAAPPPPPPRAAASTAPKAAVPAFGHLRPRTIAPRIVINGVEGWGKTSLGVHAPGAAIIMARGETGYQTLLGAGRVPSVPAVLADNWLGLLALLDQVAAEPGTIQNLVLDALGGFERLCHEHVCARDFNGEWGDKGFGSYHKGYDVSVTDWLGLLNRLDRINEKGIGVWLLSHVQVKSFKNPNGPDFDRYEAACHQKTWGVTHRWADAVLFANFFTVAEKERGATRAKGKGGADRVLYAERRDAWDAKNRYGLPESIDVPTSAAEAYTSLITLINPNPNSKG